MGVAGRVIKPAPAHRQLVDQVFSQAGAHHDARPAPGGSCCPTLQAHGCWTRQGDAQLHDEGVNERVDARSSDASRQAAAAEARRREESSALVPQHMQKAVAAISVVICHVHEFTGVLSSISFSDSSDLNLPALPVDVRPPAVDRHARCQKQSGCRPELRSQLHSHLMADHRLHIMLKTTEPYQQPAVPPACHEQPWALSLAASTVLGTCLLHKK